MAGAALGIGLALAAGQLFERVDYRVIFPGAAVLGMAASLRQRHLPVPAGAGAGAPTVGGLLQAWAAGRDAAGVLGVPGALFLFGARCLVPAPPPPPSLPRGPP